jgi:hypothetical protein
MVDPYGYIHRQSHTDDIPLGALTAGRLFQVGLQLNVDESVMGESGHPSRETEAVSRFDVDGHQDEMENRSFPLTTSEQLCRAGVPFEAHMPPCCAEPASHIPPRLTSPQAARLAQPYNVKLASMESPRNPCACD